MTRGMGGRRSVKFVRTRKRDVQGTKVACVVRTSPSNALVHPAAWPPFHIPLVLVLHAPWFAFGSRRVHGG